MLCLFSKSSPKVQKSFPHPILLPIFWPRLNVLQARIFKVRLHLLSLRGKLAATARNCEGGGEKTLLLLPALLLLFRHGVQTAQGGEEEKHHSMPLVQGPQRGDSPDPLFFSRPKKKESTAARLRVVSSKPLFWNIRAII